MPSLVTGIIGGVQARNAATNASKEQVAALLKAQGIVDAATGEVNPQILDAAMQAIAGVNTASEAAAGGIETAGAGAAAGVNTAVTGANAYLDPYAQAGQSSLAKLAGIADEKFVFNPEEDPGYQFRLAEGNKALERSAAARGTLLGGGTLKAMANYSQGLASQEYQNAFNRFQTDRNARMATLSNLAGMGLNAGGQAGRNLIGGATYAGDMGFNTARTAGGIRIGAAEYAGNTHRDAVGQTTRNTMDAAGFKANAEIDAGNARAAGHIGRANAWNGMLNQIGKTGDSMLSGGLSGDKGFSLRRMARGY